MNEELFDAALDPESMNLGPSLTRAMSLSRQRMDRVIKDIQPTHIIATVSGGRDSAAEVARAREARYIAAEIRALTPAQPQEGVRDDGWVMVPREPTEDWAYSVANGRQGQSDTPRCGPPGEYAIKRAMKDIREVLSAAPKGAK